MKRGNMTGKKNLKSAVKKTMLVSLLVNSVLILAFLVLSYAEEINVKEKIKQLAEIQTQFENKDFKERRKALENLSKIKDARKPEILKKALKDEDPIIREKSAIMLGKEKTSVARDILLESIKSNDESLRLGAIGGLGEFPKDKKAVSALIGLISNKDRNTRWKAIETLGNMKSNLAVDALLKVVKEEKEELLQKSAIESLYKIGSKKSILALKTLTKNKDEKISKWSENVLKILEK
ncbi:MAG: HEAT repeat domain-containing protein [Elusimicrobia bacterium]|nr:HEAT repeat domain-containing protein [Elusimicrobiota bacterium]